MATDMRVIIKDPYDEIIDDAAFIPWMLPSPGDGFQGNWENKVYRVKERTYMYNESGVGSYIIIQLENK
ncbi:hypothetical protein LOY35_00455 [Pseudomonas sp. B21-028]|uniref:hypothetical protein n=1 Tax=Pseudomonas sp. B21-028 TaxID=2895480 RepID=UPI002160095F|nr:hypothetical protein [Pseudomonas sp. B21-028]UVL84106.1 hypothetical protein LOY35_00455 [Pseudomonas sp. B21-028]